MTSNRRTTRVPTLPLAAIAALAMIVPAPTQARAEVTASLDGVTIWVSPEPFNGDVPFTNTQPAKDIVPNSLPYPVPTDLVIGCDTMVVAMDVATGGATVYVRDGKRLRKRAKILLSPLDPPVSYSICRHELTGPLSVVVHDRSSGGARQDRPTYTLRLQRTGMLTISPAASRELTIAGSKTRFAIVPSHVGVDLVYDPRQYPNRRAISLPSLNWLVGLLERHDGMFVGVWPPGKQRVSLGLNEQARDRCFDTVSIDMAGEPFHLSYLECPAIWHLEPLKETYLETDTAIDWKPPFPASWIGRFYVASEQIHYPFYFLHKKTEIWARAVRGWYQYPVWFNGTETMFHSEKKFPPEGDLLIYSLERDGRSHQCPDAQMSPVEIMRTALGRDIADPLLDLDGATPRKLVPHGRAVCGMSDVMTPVFAAGKEVEQKALVSRLADDIASFISRVRQRAYEFDRLAVDVDAILDAEIQARPETAESLKPLRNTTMAMRQKVKNSMPRISLDEVKAWTDQIKALTSSAGPNNHEQFLGLSFKCRSVASTQDDMVRGLNVVGIRMMEAVGEAAIHSPSHARLAERILREIRSVLRHPCPWEPHRSRAPKPDPNAGQPEE
ncbi:MAG: hypothetical protein JXQ73_10620 [Phycisphaerae bacterium]|nr:hypothetical protein [Phycisphaerae bacterium]